MRPSLEERFWSKVHKTKTCWLWTAGRFADGYGTFRVTNKMKRAHRIAWELEHGSISDDTCVLHHCDNPLCVRATHLFLGTDADNAADRVAKGRQRNLRGTDHGSSKLTTQDVQEIRKAAQQQSQRALAERYGVCHATIHYIIRRKTWSHVA